MRLAGKQNKLKEDPNMKFIEVNEDEMRGDPRDWMTKAMTEEQAPRPSGKGPKGLARSRHQITYLAHQAKERYIKKSLKYFPTVRLITFLLSGTGSYGKIGPLQGRTGRHQRTNMDFNIFICLHSPTTYMINMQTLNKLIL